MITGKAVTFFIILITIGLLLIAGIKFYYLHQSLAVYYIAALVVLPLIVLLIQIIRANTSKDFKIASLLLKFIMLFGIAFTFIIKHIYE